MKKIRRISRRRINFDLVSSNLQMPVPKRSILQRILRISEVIIGCGILLYIIGFIVENVYLGSLGVSIFDILKARYILIGGLFVFFFFSVMIPTYDFYIFYRDTPDTTVFKALFRLLKNALLTIFILFFFGTILRIFAGVKGSIHYFSFSYKDRTPISSWFTKVFPSCLSSPLRLTLVISIVAIVLIIIAILIYWIINPPINKQKVSRKENLHTLWENLRSVGIKPVIEFFVLLALFTFVYPLITSFIVFLATDVVSSSDVLNQIDLSSEYFRFGLAVLACYLALSMFLFSYIYRARVYSIKKPLSKPKLLNNVSVLIYIVTFVVALLIPIYSYGIYPLIPQQIGGGSPVSINLLLSDNEFAKVLDSLTCNPYLLDRTSTSIVIICKNSLQNNIFEIPNSKIELLSFNPLRN